MFSFSNRQPKLTFRSLLPNYLKDLHGCYSSWIYHYYFEGLNKTAHTILGLPVYPYNRMVDTSICCLYFVSSFEPLDFGILSWDWQTSKIHPGESPPAEIYTLTRSLEVRSRWKLGSAVDLNGIMMINGYEFPWFILVGLMLLRMQDNLGVWWAHSIYIPATGKLFEMGCNINRICNLARNYFHSAETLRDPEVLLALLWAQIYWRQWNVGLVNLVKQPLLFDVICPWYIDCIACIQKKSPLNVHMFFLFNSIKSPWNPFRQVTKDRFVVLGIGAFCPGYYPIFPRASWGKTNEISVITPTVWWISHGFTIYNVIYIYIFVQWIYNGL